MRPEEREGNKELVLATEATGGRHLGIVMKAPVPTTPSQLT